MRIFLTIFAFCYLGAQGQLKAVILRRAGSNEAINMYEQIPPKNPNGRLAAGVTWLHGQGERGIPGDTTSANGLPKLKNAGTSPFATLATTMMPRYLIPGGTDSIYYAVFMPQCSTAYSTWPTWYDSAVQAYIRTYKADVVDTNRIMICGHSQGGGGTWNVYADSSTAVKHNFGFAISSGYFAPALAGAGYANVCRWGFPFDNFHSVDDGTAAVSITDAMVGGSNLGQNGSVKGPLNPIQYKRFSGATPGTSGHNITFVPANFTATNASYMLSTGESWKFDMTEYQKALLYTLKTPSRPPGF